MCSLYNSQGCTYPSEELSSGGAPDIETFCDIIAEEANAENVRGEVVFAQAMLETGWLDLMEMPESTSSTSQDLEQPEMESKEFPFLT